MAYTIGSLFSGIGGFDLAARWAGFETAWFVEKEPYCQQVLARHWPGVPVHGDIYDTHDLPYVDVITAGFPCQPFSVAGKRMGADDERFLIPEMMRVINDVQPRVVFLENVPGFASLNDGAEFKQLLRALAQSGYDAEWQHIRASDVGAPHRRERWFLLAYASSLRRGSGGNNQPERYLLYNPVWNTPQDKSKRDRWICRIGANGDFMGNAKRGGRRWNTWRRNGAQLENGYVQRIRDVEPRLGRDNDGLSGGLDFPGFPARPGEPQRDYEPPRVVPPGQSDRASRIKALGNAIVPQVVYPQFVTIREWLDAQAIEQAA